MDEPEIDTGTSFKTLADARAHLLHAGGKIPAERPVAGSEARSTVSREEIRRRDELIRRIREAQKQTARAVHDARIAPPRPAEGTTISMTPQESRAVEIAAQQEAVLKAREQRRELELQSTPTSSRTSVIPSQQTRKGSWFSRLPGIRTLVDRFKGNNGNGHIEAEPA